MSGERESAKKPICYLCNKEIPERERSKDHVPPAQFFATSIRKAHNLNLLTLPTHHSCNKAYQFDEDYFVNSLGPLAETLAGKELYQDIRKGLKRDEAKRLAQKILREFDPNPGGLCLPYGKVLKRFEGDRVFRVVWKIIRGLFSHHYGRYLMDSESIPIQVKLVQEGDVIPDALTAVRSQE